MSGKFNLGEKLTEELGIPKTIVNGYNHIELFGNREAIVNQCEGILEYSEERIKLNLGKNTILFCGSDLCMKEYGTSQAVLSGNILTIEFG
ncbi:MAG: YabP/YqfC family sporulation protein [Clostridia bacterium]|nr:YabP/YqfC family sporulation protein [Clostridia bacterium]